MKARKIQAKHIFSTIALSAVFFANCQDDRIEREKESLTPVTFEKVALEDDFWLPRLKIQKETLVPFSLEKTENAVENLRRVGEWVQKGKGQKLLNLPRYVASDLFKVMEGAASLLAVERDAELEKQMDEIIDIIADSQCEDGYLYEIFSVPKDMHHHH
ncbi:MAG: glycoside hydrolase family 127 protein, partial [Alistipes sp.]|nr:glycoside hydrolase family 127 protein [Alistipes sp.]